MDEDRTGRVVAVLGNAEGAAVQSRCHPSESQALGPDAGGRSWPVMPISHGVTRVTASPSPPSPPRVCGRGTPGGYRRVAPSSGIKLISSMFG